VRVLLVKPGLGYRKGQKRGEIRAIQGLDGVGDLRLVFALDNL
jgi:hypothetical protein